MKRAILVCILSAGVVAAGCDVADGLTGSGGSGGAGGFGGAGGGEPPTETRWAISNVTTVSDDCNFGDLDGVFIIKTDGTMATMMLEEFVLDAETTEYSPELTEVPMAGSLVNDEFDLEFGCSVLLTEEFTLFLDDPTVSLPENSTLQVQWDHLEEDDSVNFGDCEGVWFVPLPCTTAEDFTLTKLAE
ncbi:MAG: hypothetical protein JRF55_15540 [Deltaproteobacteria bacterium]|nr:hypothetical protein [Deltaproteobacteria bacterium]MBW2377371.1 hypothetical protein [Deltaproteobacteria bacterium]